MKHQLKVKNVTEALQHRERFSELAAWSDKVLGIQTAYDNGAKKWKTEVVVLQHGEVVDSYPMSKAGIAQGVQRYNELP
ncbi:MAG: hypothetical protein M1378_11915 [Bacteroidetes bacterium]|nr:hypothetical protein [Bacteroidota bacterium]